MQARTRMAKQKRTHDRVLRLKKQLEGGTPTPKEPTTPPTSNTTTFTLPTNLVTPKTVSKEMATDTNYLRQDLTKIGILSSIAIGIQLSLFFAQRAGLTSRWF